MIPELTIVRKGKLHKKRGYELPICLIDGVLYRVYPSCLQRNQTTLLVGDFNFQKGCTYLIFKRGYYFGHVNTVENGDYFLNAVKTNRLKEHYKIESLESILNYSAGLKICSIVGFEEMFYQLIPLEE